MEKSLLIFDFDGTLADTRALIIETGNAYAAEAGLQPITEDDIRVYRDEGVRALMAKRNFSVLDVVKILNRGSVMFAEKAGLVKLVPGIAGTLEGLEKKGIRMAVVTSNTEESVRKVLGESTKVFSGIFPEKDLFGKTAKLKKVLKSFKTDPADAFYIGDEPRDMEAAKSAGIHPVGVTWGFGSERSLISAGAERIIKSPKALVDLIMN